MLSWRDNFCRGKEWLGEMICGVWSGCAVYKLLAWAAEKQECRISHKFTYVSIISDLITSICKLDDLVKNWSCSIRYWGDELLSPLGSVYGKTRTWESTRKLVLGFVKVWLQDNAHGWVRLPSVSQLWNTANSVYIYVCSLQRLAPLYSHSLTPASTAYSGFQYHQLNVDRGENSHSIWWIAWL